MKHRSHDHVQEAKLHRSCWYRGHRCLPGGTDNPEGDAYDGLVASYESKYGGLPVGTFHAQTHDAANLRLSAIAAVAIQEENGTLHIGRQALRDALYATRDFQGLTGSLSCDEFGDIAPS